MTVQHFGKYTRVHDMPSSNQIVYYKVTGEMYQTSKYLLGGWLNLSFMTNTTLAHQYS